MAYKQRGHAQPGINQRAQDPPKKGNTKTTFGDKLKSAWYSEIGGNTGTHAYNAKKQEFRNYRAKQAKWESSDPKTRGEAPKSPSWMTGF